MAKKCFNSLFCKSITGLILMVVFFSCRNSNYSEKKGEQIRVEENTSFEEFEKIDTGSIKKYIWPSSIVLTGISHQRIIAIYRNKYLVDKDNRISRFSGDFGEDETYTYEHYYPGFDLLSGYNLINLSYFQIPIGKTKLFFNKAVLIKSLYFPSFIQDSIEKKPILRDYYLVSVYDEDTNNDKILDRKDFRHFYCFSDSCTNKKQLLPNNTSLIRAQYDSPNDLLYLYAKLDENKNGSIEKTEPLNIYLLNLKYPSTAKKIY